MKKETYNCFIRVVFVLLFFVFVESCSQNEDTKEMVTTEDMNAYLNQQLKDSIFLGAIYYKSIQGNDTIFVHGNATRGIKKKINEETLFEIGSVSKTFTALLVAIAVEEGILNYDDPVEMHLPDTFIIPKNVGGKITIRQLITHRSGLPYLPANIRTDNLKNQTYDFLNYSSKDLYEFLKDHKIEGIAADSSIYSIAGYSLLGYMLENIYQKTYNQLIVSKITEPLNMTRTSINYKDHIDDNYADGYIGQINANWYRNDSSVTNASGSIRSCIKDLRLYARAHAGLDETSLYPAMQRMKEVQFLGSHTHIGRNEVCLGWGKKGNFYYHFGGTQGFISFFTYNPKNSKIMILHANVAYNQLSIPWLLNFGNNEMENEL